MRFGNRKFCGEDLLLYAVTDRRWLHGAALCEQVEQALLGGVTMVQLREKEMSGRQLFKEAEKLRALCAHYQVPFIVNDNVAVAKKVDADGVHLGQNDTDVPWARRLLGLTLLSRLSIILCLSATSSFRTCTNASSTTLSLIGFMWHSSLCFWCFKHTQISTFFSPCCWLCLLNLVPHSPHSSFVLNG